MNSRHFLLSLLLGAILASCAAPSVERGAPATGGSAFAEAPEDRPGLGTKWGETRKSSSGTTRFARATPPEPLATAEIFYNDRAGIEAMAAASQLRRTWPVISGPASSLVSVGLKDQSGRFLPGLSVGDRWFVVGEEGRRYSIWARNRSDLRLEIVLSVDGLDVLDGRPASIRKRGYVIDPHRTLIVEGFRQSTEAVAAFRFSPVRESYAQEKYRNTRNVGVIGIALFHERGTYPWSDREVRKRLRANPFSNHFATPP
ncbi:MAG: hypothetical protein H0X34_05830 [Chthoniobacterales bacterium]|nr:hypothetical protein [Chthoniobacterales bacterium]